MAVPYAFVGCLLLLLFVGSSHAARGRAKKDLHPLYAGFESSGSSSSSSSSESPSSYIEPLVYYTTGSTTATVTATLRPSATPSATVTPSVYLSSSGSISPLSSSGSSIDTSTSPFDPKTVVNPGNRTLLEMLLTSSDSNLLSVFVFGALFIAILLF